MLDCGLCFPVASCERNALADFSQVDGNKTRINPLSTRKAATKRRVAKRDL
jgi:hypothetical protein